MISYYMVAVFVTIYYVILFPGLMDAYGQGYPLRPRSVSRYHKFVSGFEESVTGFLDAMLLFAISMLVAAITRYASLTLHPDDTHSLFGLQNCVVLSTFAIFPALVLQSLSFDTRRRRVRLALWDLVIVFAITVEVLYRVYYRSYVDSDGNFGLAKASLSKVTQMAWFNECQDEQSRQEMQIMLSIGHAFMLANVAMWLYNVAEIYAGPRWLPALRRREALWKRWTEWKLLLRLLNGLCCLMLMWGFLLFFSYYRSGMCLLRSLPHAPQYLLGDAIASVHRLELLTRGRDRCYAEGRRGG